MFALGSYGMLCSTYTIIMKPCCVRNVSGMLVGYTCHVYFKEFVTWPRVVSISMLLCPCNIDGMLSAWLMIIIPIGHIGYNFALKYDKYEGNCYGREKKAT